MAFTQEQRNNAKIIYEVGLSLGASMRDIQIALMAGLVESGLRNLDYGDRDSIGMFQQRDAWGSREARLDPRQSAKMFFTGGNAGQRGLLDFSDRASMDMGAAAQAVQVSAFPDRYAQHASEAKGILNGLDSTGGTTATNVPAPTTTTTTTNGDALAQVADLDSLVKSAKSGATSMPVTAPSVMEVNSLGEITADDAGIGALSFDGANPALQAQTFQPKFDPMAGVKMPELGSTTTTTTATSGEEWRNGIVAQARKMLGTPYAWGGKSYSGVDCSGLIALVYNKMGFSLPRISADQARSGKRVGIDQLRPGDLVAWDNNSRNNGADHIAIYVGNGQVIEATRPGTSVQLSSIYDKDNAWGVRLDLPGESGAAGTGHASHASHAAPSTAAPDAAPMTGLGVKPHVAQAAGTLGKMFGITDIGGYRESAIDPAGHPSGLALDFMVSDNRGTELAAYAIANADKFNVDYIIWRGRINSLDGRGWRSMEDRGSPTANHMDHVHINFQAK